MRESKIEEAFCARAKERNGVPYKFVSPGRIGVPDRLVLYPVPPEHRKIVSQYVRFAELKAPGKLPKPWQVREHKRLKKMGFVIEVIDEI